MPLHSFDAPPHILGDTIVAKSSGEPMIVCTLDEKDDGDACRYCGGRAGPGHGKEVGGGT